MILTCIICSLYCCQYEEPMEHGVWRFYIISHKFSISHICVAHYLCHIYMPYVGIVSLLSLSFLSLPLSNFCVTTLFLDSKFSSFYFLHQFAQPGIQLLVPQWQIPSIHSFSYHFIITPSILPVLLTKDDAQRSLVKSAYNICHWSITMCSRMHYFAIKISPSSYCFHTQLSFFAPNSDHLSHVHVLLTPWRIVLLTPWRMSL